MKRGIIYLILVALILTALAAAYGPFRGRARQLAADLNLIRADTADVMASATYQRYAARRKAVEQMRAGLRTIAAAESAFVADSGRPTSVFLPDTRYAFTTDPANQISVEIQRDRWVAQARNNHTSMSCSLTAMLDTTGPNWRYHVGEPVCAEWTAESIAIAAAPTPSESVPVAALPNDRGNDPPQRPRPHRQWGPLNNTPPHIPYIVENTCEGEGCASTGTWAACSTLTARDRKDARAAAVFMIQPGERFTALKGDVHVDVAGMVGFRRAMVNPPDREGVGSIDSIQFTPADTLYLLNSHGEGYLVMYFRGQTVEGYEFWDDPGDRGASAILLHPTKTTLWIRVRNAAGKEGWIVADYYKMATGGYMDEVERCLRR